MSAELYDSLTVDLVCRECGVCYSIYNPPYDEIIYPLCMDCQADKQEQEENPCY